MKSSVLNDFDFNRPLFYSESQVQCMRLGVKSCIKDILLINDFICSKLTKIKETLRYLVLSFLSQIFMALIFFCFFGFFLIVHSLLNSYFCFFPCYAYIFFKIIVEVVYNILEQFTWINSSLICITGHYELTIVSYHFNLSGPFSTFVGQACCYSTT